MSDPNTNISGTPGDATTPPPPPPAAVTATPPAGATAPAAAAPKPAAPAAAAKPPAKPAGKERRFFLAVLLGSWMAAGFVALTGGLGAMLLGTVRFMFPNVLSEPPSRVKVGFPDQFEEGKVVERYKDQNIWVVRKDGIIYALSTTCTHLGCTPNWLEREEKFKCPCHGSGFKMSGINFEGPAPRPLERWGVSVGDDGQLVVDKGKKFQQERGEWTNPESFIKV
jgi:cytochrome b6-f complex iron-sulfur subunit